MTDTASKAEAMLASGLPSTSVGVSTDALGCNPTDGATTTGAQLGNHKQTSIDSAQLAHQPIGTPRALFVLGGVLLGGGIAVWVLGSQGVFGQAGSTEVVSVLGLLGAIAVGAMSLQQALGRSSHRIGDLAALPLLPLGGLVLIALSAICQFFVRDVEASPEVSAAPLVLGGLYTLMRAAAVRGWLLAGTNRSALFPPSFAQHSVLVPGERLTLETGDVAPVDCRVQQGSVALQERYISPVTHFRIKDEAEIVFAGSTIVGGSAECVALTTSKDSCLRRLEAAIEGGLQSAEQHYRRGDENIVRLYAYAILFCSIAAAISWNERSGSPTAVISAAGLVLFTGSLGLVVDLVYSSYARLVRQWAARGYVLFSDESCRDLSNVNEVHFDPSTVDSGSLCTVRELDLLDDRISRDALCSTLLSILGRADDTALAALGDYCSQWAANLTTERVMDLREYEGWGICGSVKGIEFSIGSEGFLVERGIMVQPSDNVGSTTAHERTMLVAIDHDVIARCVVSFGQQSLASADAVDSAWSECLGVEPRMASIESRELPEGALLVRGNESEALVRSHAVTATGLPKDSLRPPRATVLLLTNSLRELPELLTECRDSLRWARLCRGLVVATGILLVAAVFLGLVTPIVPAVLIPLVTVLVLI